MKKTNGEKPTFQVTALTAAIGAVLATPAWAAEQASSSVIEEVIVTATKREAAASDLPVAVTVVNNELINELQMTNVLDLDKVVPGLKIRYVGADPSIIIRGAGTAGTNDVAVPIYVDGLYRPRYGQGLASWLDVERVELLRGPQGTLFGRNTFGGLANIIARKPDATAFDWGGGATVGDYSYRRLEGFVNVPLGEAVAVRVTGSDTFRDPLIENVFNDEGGMRDDDSVYARAQLQIDLTASFDITFSTTYWKDDSNGNADYAGVILGIPVNPTTGLTDGVNGVMQLRQGRIPGTENDSWPPTGGRNQAGTFGSDPAASITPGIHRISSDFTPLRKIDETSFSVLVNWDLGPVTLRANMGSFDYEEFRLTDSDFSPNPTGWAQRNSGVTPPASTGRTYWAQCWGGPSCGLAAGQRVNSNATQADINLTYLGEGRLLWTLGYFSYDDSGDGDTSSEFVWGYTDSTAPQNVTWGHWLYQGNGGTKSTAIYGQAEYSLTDRLRVTAGVRRSTDERNFFNKYVDWGPSVHGFGAGYTDAHLDDPGSRFASWPVFVATDASASGRQTGKASNIDWRASVQYDVSNEMLLYASAATGYIAGSIEGGGSTELTDPNEVDTYEIGMKNRLLDGVMVLNLAAYQSSYAGLTTSSFVAQGQTIVAVGNVGGTMTSRGLEVELTWMPNEDLNIRGGLALNDSELQKFGRSVLNRVFRSGGDQQIVTTMPCDHTCSQVYVLDGKDARFSPSYTLAVDISYAFNLANNKGRVEPGVYIYRSASYKTTNIEYFFTHQDAYTSVDLRANWTRDDSPVTVQAFVKNATDVEVQIGGDQYSQGRAVADFKNPRTMGLRVAWNF